MTTNAIRRRAARVTVVSTLALVLAALVAGPVLAATRPGENPRGGSSPLAEELRAGPCAALWTAARTSPTVATVKAAALCEVDRRLATIERLDKVIADAERLTDAHQAALQSILDRSESGLRLLRAEIEADTTLPDLRVDARRIFTEYRIYALVSRQVRLVVAADAVDAGVARGERIAERLDAAIEKAEEGGADVTDAKARLASLHGHLDAAHDDVAGIAAAVLPLTPADLNDGTAGPVLQRSRERIADARRVELRAAIADARAIIADLR